MKDYGNFTIVLPTLNEQGTIGAIIERILSEYKGIDIIVADDGSTDGTKKIVLKYSKKTKSVRLIDRHARNLKKGLTASIVDGIRLSRTRYAIVMDADLQHPPAKIKEIARMLKSGDDLVVAWKVDMPNWALYRRVISRVLIAIGKLVLFFGQKETCNDIFSGFFGVDRKIFTGVAQKNRGRFVMEGYKALFDFLKCVRRGTLRIGEVPIVFSTRKSGSSKVGIRQGIAAIRSFLT